MKTKFWNEPRSDLNHLTVAAMMDSSGNQAQGIANQRWYLSEAIANSQLISGDRFSAVVSNIVVGAKDNKDRESAYGLNDLGMALKNKREAAAVRGQQISVRTAKSSRILASARSKMVPVIHHLRIQVYFKTFYNSSYSLQYLCK